MGNGALYTVCGPFLINLRTPFLLSVMCVNILLCAVVWLTASLQVALLWLANLDLATIGFFLHYRSLFRVGTFTPQYFGCWGIPSLFLMNRAYARSTPLFVLVTGGLLFMFTRRWARELSIKRLVKERATRIRNPPPPLKLDLAVKETPSRTACSPLLSGQAIVDPSVPNFQATIPVTADMPKQGAVFRLFVFYHTESPDKSRVWGIRRSTGFFFTPNCALTVLHVKPLHPQSTVVALVGTNDLAARLEDIFPSLTAELQEGLRHHLPNSTKVEEGTALRLIWFRAALDLEDDMRAALRDLALELEFPKDDLHPYRVTVEDVEDVGRRAARGDAGPSGADFFSDVRHSSATPYIWPQFCDVVLLRAATPVEDYIPLDTQYCTSPTNILLSLPAVVYGYPTSSVFRDHYRHVLTQFSDLAKRSMLMQCFCYYNKKVRSEGTAWLPPALAEEARIADTREMPELIAKCPEIVKDYHRQLGFLSCSTELEMAGAPVIVHGSALGLHIGGVPVENRNLFLFIHHPMVVVYLYLRCHKEEGLYAYFNSHVELLSRVLHSASWYQLQDAYLHLKDIDR